MQRERERSRERGSPAPTPEERDCLERSRRKLWEEGGGLSREMTLIPRVEEWMSTEVPNGVAPGGEGVTRTSEPKTKWTSFKEAVTQMKESMEEEEEDWWSDGRWKERVEVVMTENGLNVLISQKEKERLAKRWQQALIVKLLRRMIDSEYLERKVQQLWAREGEVDTIDVGSGFFVVKFSAVQDYELPITGGPWLIFDHYLAIQPWKMNFKPQTESITKIAAWIRLTNLPLDYYDKGILYVLGSQIGKVLKVDMTTLRRKKGRFARLCVELDLATPLPPMILIDGEEQRVQYEGIHLICFKCGRYGHDRDHCGFKTSNGVGSNMELGGGHVEGKMVVQEGVEDGRKENHGGAGGENATMPEGKEGRYSEWMLVQRPRRSRRMAAAGAGMHESRRESRVHGWNEGRGSRFLALEREGITELPNMQEAPQNKWAFNQDETRGRRGFNEITSIKKSRESQGAKHGDRARKMGEKTDLTRKLGGINEMEHLNGTKNEGKRSGPAIDINGQSSQIVKRSVGPGGVSPLLNRSKIKVGQEGEVETIRGSRGDAEMKEAIPNNMEAIYRLDEEGDMAENGISREVERNNHEDMEEDNEPPDPRASGDGIFMVHSNPLSGDPGVEEAPKLEATASSSC